MSNTKLFSFFSVSFLLSTIAVPSMAQTSSFEAAIVSKTALSGCQAIFGTVETAGSGGLSSGSGSLVATSPGINIIICDTGSLLNRDFVAVGLESANPNSQSACSVSWYNLEGEIIGSQTKGLESSPQIALFFDDIANNFYSQLSCRLDQGDKVSGYIVAPEV